MADPNDPLTDKQLITGSLVCRALGGGVACSAIALKAGYTVRGTIVTRILYVTGASDTAFLDRSTINADNLIFLRNVTVKLFESSKDVDKDAPLSQTTTSAKGVFQLPTILKVGVEYKLLAIYKNDDKYLKEERVLIEKLKVDKIPDPDKNATVSLDQKNKPAKDSDTYIKVETETLDVPISRKGVANAVLDFSDKAMLAFESCSLDMPYINQNQEEDLSTKTLNIESNGDVSGSILCFPTSAAMVMDYYGQTPNTTQLMATQNYNTWKADHFQSGIPHATGTDKYRFTYGNAVDPDNPPSNVWEWWAYENRSIRSVVGLTINQKGDVLRGSVEDMDGFPDPDVWQTYWEQKTITDSSHLTYVRRHIGRGWPIILGTKLTSAGHVVALRGLVVAKDGSIYKYIVNNPWGTKSKNDKTGAITDNWAHGVYYDTSYTDPKSKGKFTIADHLTLRRGMTRDQVLDKMVPGSP